MFVLPVLASAEEFVDKRWTAMRPPNWICAKDDARVRALVVPCEGRPSRKVTTIRAYACDVGGVIERDHKCRRYPVSKRSIGSGKLTPSSIATTGSRP